MIWWPGFSYLTFGDKAFLHPSSDKRLKGGQWNTSHPLTNQPALPCFLHCCCHQRLNCCLFCHCNCLFVEQYQQCCLNCCFYVLVSGITFAMGVDSNFISMCAELRRKCAKYFACLILQITISLSVWLLVCVIALTKQQSFHNSWGKIQFRTDLSHMYTIKY